MEYGLMPAQFVGATNAWNNGASGGITVNVPAGVQNGDVLLLMMGEYAGDSQAIPTPTGWTLWQVTASSAWTGLWSRTASGEPASYTFITSLNHEVAAVMLAYRGVTLSSSAIQANASSLNVIAPSLAPAAGDLADILVSLFNTGSNESSISQPASQTLRQNSPVTSSPCVFASDETLTSDSATGTRTATMSPYAAANVGVSVLLRPVNAPPNAPTGLAPASGTVDRSIVQRLSWMFSDPNAGDSQSKFDLQWRHAGTSDAWNAVSQTTPNNYWDAPASTFPAEQIEWQVRTYDQSAAVGPWSALAYFTAGDPATPPTITAPVSGGTISQNPTTVTWSTAGQQAYQVRRVKDNAGTADPTTVYWDSGQVVDTATRSLSVPFETNNRWEHVQVRVQQSGLWSAWSDVRVNVSYTTPATASLAATPNNTAGSISIAITNPAPSGGQPAVAYNDVYVRTVGDTGPGVRIATQVANNGTATYWTPASGVAYQFLARTFGSNSTSTDSAWTA